MSTLVVRFSSFGDIVLAGAVTGALAPVRFLTLRRYAGLAAALPGVEEVLVWEDRPSLEADKVVDLHGSWRSRRALWGRRRGRIQRFDLKRRLRVALKTSSAPSVIERYGKAAAGSPAPLPWIQCDGPGDALLLCPGASTAKKRWGGFVELGKRWSGPTVVLGGPGEENLVQSVADPLGADAVVGEMAATLAAVGRARVAVANDSGLMHLCGAAGVPVVGLFGPTHPDDGFWCYPTGQAVGLGLFCSPCSRHGEGGCAIGDHACLDQLTVDQVWRHVEQLCVG